MSFLANAIPDAGIQRIAATSIGSKLEEKLSRIIGLMADVRSMHAQIRREVATVEDQGTNRALRAILKQLGL